MVNSKGIPVRMLIAALLTYSLIILAMWHFKIDEHYAFLLTTQGFIILYGGAVLAFMREVTRWWQWAVGLLAGASWVFLMQGFGWLILYPTVLMLVGVILKSRRARVVEAA